MTPRHEQKDIVDPEALSVRYLLIEITNASEAKTTYVLMPTGLAEVDETSDHVLLGGMNAALIPDLPRYRGDRILRDKEWALRRIFTQEDEWDDPVPAGTFYDHALFNDARFLERRRRVLHDRSGSLTSSINTNPYLRRR